MFIKKIKKKFENKYTSTFLSGLIAQQLAGCGGGASEEVAQNVTLRGTSGNDLLVSNATYSAIEGLAGNDRIYGTSGPDEIYPGDGLDEVFAAAGDDVVNIYAFGDTIFGDEGNDTLVADFTDTQVLLRISLQDGVIFNLRAPSFERTTFSNIENFELHSDNSVEVIGTDFDNQIVTAGGNDTIIAGNGNNIINTGAGDDIITFTSIGSSIDGGTGSDKLIYDASDLSGLVSVDLTSQVYQLGGNSLNQRISNFEIYEFQGVANFTITGTNNAEEIICADGNDTIDGLGGADTLTGGNGSDKFVFSVLSNALDTITDFETGINGDTIRLNKSVFDLAGNALQSISTQSGGIKNILETTGVILVNDETGFMSETALISDLVGVNGIIDGQTNLGNLMVIWKKANETSAVMSYVSDDTPSDSSLDYFENIALLTNITSANYSELSITNFEII